MDLKIENSIQDDSFFNYLCKTISPDHFNGQILIEIGKPEHSIDRVSEIIKDHKIEIKKMDFFKDSDGQQGAVLFTLNAEDVQEVVLKLVENGFLKIICFKPVETG